MDSDMQNLVYENYNKFISATDTIRKMKHNVADMEREMELLVSSMEKTRYEKRDQKKKTLNETLFAPLLLLLMSTFFLFHLSGLGLFSHSHALSAHPQCRRHPSLPLPLQCS